MVRWHGIGRITYLLENGVSLNCIWTNESIPDSKMPVFLPGVRMAREKYTMYLLDLSWNKNDSREAEQDKFDSSGD